MSILLKAGLGVLCLSAISIPGISLYYPFFPSTIGEELLSKGENFIPKENPKWDTLAKNHAALEAKSVSQTEKPKTIEGLQLKDKTNTMKDELFKECEKLLNTPLDEAKDQNLNRKKQEAKDWCIGGASGLTIKDLN